MLSKNPWGFSPEKGSIYSLLYLAFKTNNTTISASVTAFATRIGNDLSATPYTSHKNTPNPNATSMPRDKSSQRLLLHALCTCGTNDSVVSVPAANPSNVIQP